MIRAVVFDFDGVIANSEPLHFRAFREVLAGRGISLTERNYYDRYLGFDDVGAFVAVAADNGVLLADAEVAAMVARKALVLEALERGNSVLFAGAAEAVRRMARCGPIAIASGARRAEITRVLEHEGLTGLFPVVVAAEDTPKSKPAPDPYLLAVSELGRATGQPLQGAECVAVEDSRWGLESARAAGLMTVAVTHTYPPEELTRADMVIDHLDELSWEAMNRLQPRVG